MDVISKNRSILIFNKFIEIDDLFGGRVIFIFVSKFIEIDNLLGCNHLATSKNVKNKKNLVVKEENVEVECYDEWTGGKQEMRYDDEEEEGYDDEEKYVKGECKERKMW